MREQLHSLVLTAIQHLQAQQVLPISDIPVVIENSRNKAHGDFACNIALVLAKQAQLNPKQLAEKIVAALPANPVMTKIEIAGPGFINFYVREDAFQQIVKTILQAGERYGFSTRGAQKKIYLEFVSANPTGPLHVGHGRGAAYGASLANILEAVGYRVHREYYVNDAGRQMQILAISVWLRYLELFNEIVDFPLGGYRGDYIAAIAQQLQKKYQQKFVIAAAKISANLPTNDEVNKDAYVDALVAKAPQLLGQENYEIVFQWGLEDILADIREDLSEFGLTYDAWFYESSLVKNGAIARGIERLTANGHTYEEDGAIWFKGTHFGDEKDRVLIRRDGRHTYFAADVGYHLHKYESGADLFIDIFGADHHGYISRIKGFLEALGLDSDRLTILLVQFAILYRGQEKVQMSTRSGEFVTLRTLRDEVGNDAARYFYVARKAEQHLDFDLALATEHSNENPVYYIQYAHARICSVFAQAQEQQKVWQAAEGEQALAQLTSDHEEVLLRLLSQYPDLLNNAAEQSGPHLLAHYLQELAGALHTYYNASKFLVDDSGLRNARLCLIKAVQIVLASGMRLLGISMPTQM